MIKVFPDHTHLLFHGSKNILQTVLTDMFLNLFFAGDKKENKYSNEHNSSQRTVYKVTLYYT